MHALNKIGRLVAQTLGLFAGLLILYPVWLALKGISGPSARRRFTDPFEKSLSHDSEGGTEEPVLSEAVRRTRWTVWLIRALVVALLIGLFPFGLWAPPAEAHNRTVTMTPTTATNTVGTTHTVVATATYAANHNNDFFPVTFSFIASGTGVETPSSSVTTRPSTGASTFEVTASFSFTSTKTGTSTITLTVTDADPDGASTTTHTATKNWHHGPPTTVTVIPTTDTNTVGDPHTITATATDQYGNPISNHTATISVTGAGATQATRTTDASGTVTFTFSSDDPGTSNIRVTVTSNNTHAAGSSGTATGTATKVWQAGPATVDSITLQPKNATNTVGEIHTVTATVQADGDPAPGVLVTFTVSGTGGEIPKTGTDTTNSDGKATFSFTSTKTGDSHITATTTGEQDTCELEIPVIGECVIPGPAEPLQDTATKTWIAGAASTITLMQDSATNIVGDPHTVTATVTDQYGNAVADGTDVTFTVTGVGATEGVRDTTNGVATFTFTSSETGQSTIQARFGEEPESRSNTLNKTWVLGPPDSIVLTQGSATNQVGQPHTVTATVRDSNNNLVADGTPVTFTVTGVGATQGVRDTTNGIATFTFTSTQAGTSTITATSGDATSNTLNKTWTAGPPGSVVITQGPSTNQVGQPHTVTATVRDSNNNLVADGTPVTFTVTGVGATEGVRETTNGIATFTFTSTQSGTSTITATSGNAPTSNTLNKTWVAGPAESLVLEPENATNTVGETHTVTATVYDADNNPVPGVMVTFTVGGTGFETPTFGTDTTDDSGKATFSFTSTKTGESDITATAREESCELEFMGFCLIGEVEAIQDTATKTWVAGQASTITLTQGSATNTVGQPHTVTATVVDQYGNAVANGTDVTFTVTGVGATEGARDTTNGVATFTFTSLQSGQSTITARSGGATSNTLIKTWVAGAPDHMTLEPETATNTVGETHTVTATIRDEHGNPVRTTGTVVTFTVTGTGAENPKTGTDTTDDNGEAHFSFTSTQTGTSTITATSANGFTATATKTWMEEEEEDPVVPGPEDGSGPDAASWQSNRIDVVVRGTDNQIWHRWYDGANGWHGYESLGGQATSDPSTVSWGPNRLDIFVRGTDNALWHRWYENGTWYGWESLGGVLTSAPDVSSWGPNRLDVFARGTDGQLYHRWWDGSTWQGWEGLGGQLTSGPSAVSWGDNRIDVFVRGTDNALWHAWWDGSTWQGYESLGGVLTSDPDVASWGPNRLDIFVRGTDNQMWHRWYDGANGWHGYAPRGGVLTSAPGAVSWGLNRIDVFVRGTDAALWHAWWNGTVWEGYESLGGQLQ